MKINRNMSAVLTNKQMHRTENKLSASMERLSSGLKINKPGDNPSGMAISNKMRAQIRALDQAEDNASDAINVMQIADGALNEVTSILQRIRELSVQAANGTNTYEDRQSIQAEIDQLTNEVSRISSDTEYNTKNLLDGSSDTRVYAENKNVTRIHTSDQVDVGTYEMTVAKVATKASSSLPSEDTITGDSTISINGVEVKVTAGMSHDEYVQAIRDAATEAGCDLEVNQAGASYDYTITTTYPGSSRTLEVALSKNLTAAGFVYDDELDMNVARSAGTDAEVTLGDPFGNTASVHADGNRVYVTDKNGFAIDFLMDDTVAAGDAVSLEVTDIGKMMIQTGGNEYQTIGVRIPEVSATAMYLDTVDVTVAGGAKRALDTLDDALDYINEVRSRIGAYQNRFEYSQQSLAETSENMTSAYSTLTDTDMAEEMTEYTQQNVLEQAAISVLAQANELPQQVLSLLQ